MAAQDCLYVLDQLHNALTAVRRDSNTVAGILLMPTDDCQQPPCHPMPTALEFSAATMRAYVTRQDVNLVYVLDPVENTVVDTVPIDSGSSLVAASAAAALSPDGGSLYVANLASDSVSVIATSSNQLVDTIGVGNQPRAVAFTPDGTTVFVGNNLDDNVSVIRAADRTVIDSIDVGNAPAGIAVSPDGARAYVCNGNDKSVSVIDVANRAVIDTITVGQSPRGVAVTPDGASAFVTNVLDGTVSVIDTASRSVVGDPIAVGAGPVAIALTADGAAAYVANLMSSTVSVIDTTSRAVNTINGVAAPFDLSFGPCPVGPTPTPTVGPGCVGDCDHSGEVAVNELIIGVNIALGSRPIGDCPLFDTNGSGQVEVSELIRAVNNTLDGC